MILRCSIFPRIFSRLLYISERGTFILSSISLDPEEDVQDPNLFSELAAFLDKDLDLAEREQVFTKTIPRMVERAKALRSTKPPQGLHFSLQQQGIARFDIILITENRTINISNINIKEYKYSFFLSFEIVK